MERAFIVRGHLRDPLHIELDEPLADMANDVEVTVRPIAAGAAPRAMIPADWEHAFDAWVDGHDRTLPLPTSESLRREALYDDRG